MQSAYQWPLDQDQTIQFQAQSWSMLKKFKTCIIYYIKIRWSKFQTTQSWSKNCYIDCVKCEISDQLHEIYFQEITKQQSIYILSLDLPQKYEILDFYNVEKCERYPGSCIEQA
jgi:hypothetical protein